MNVSLLVMPIQLLIIHMISVYQIYIVFYLCMLVYIILTKFFQNMIIYFHHQSIKFKSLNRNRIGARYPLIQSFLSCTFALSNSPVYTPTAHSRFSCQFITHHPLELANSNYQLTYEIFGFSITCQ